MLAFATKPLQDMGSDVSEAVANQERQESNVEAMRQREEGDGPESEDIIALEELMGDLAERTQSQTKGMSLGFRRPESISPEIAPDVEERARELARQSWAAMPDPVKARVDYDFEEYWKVSAGRFRREAAS